MQTELTKKIRAFVAVEALTFCVAAAIHFGYLIDGYGHQAAGTAESVIGGALLIGLVLSLIRPAWTATAGVVIQGFALVGTLIGIFTIIVGIGPRTTADIVYHIGIVVVLVIGLVIALRART